MPSKGEVLNHNITPSRIPPHNIEAEQAVLASALIDAHVIDELMGVLNIEDFYQSAHQVIYNALLSLHHSGKPLDLVTLVTRLMDEGNIEKAGGIDYVSELVRIIPNAANVSAYAKILREKSILRELISAGGEITELGFNVTSEIDDLLDSAQKKVYDLAQGKRKSGAEHIRDVVLRNNAKLQALYESDKANKDVSGVPSGFVDLDAITNGFQRSDLIIVAGRPGMGKTSFGLNIMLNAAHQNFSCAFFTLEMSSEQLLNRLISCEAKINSSKLRTGDLNLDEMADYNAFATLLSKLEIYLDETPQVTVHQIRTICRKLSSQGKLDMIFVDYLQIMGFNDKITVREQQISEISRSLKSLAKELNVPVMAFAQVNRGVESRSDNRRPYLSDLRESGAIEQDADIIMFLYRDEVYNEESPMQGVAEIIIAKHRNGETGTVYLSFDKNYTQFGKRGIDKSYLAALIKDNKPTKRTKKALTKED